MDLTNGQLMALRHLLPAGFEVSLLAIVLRRCSIEQPAWDVLVSAGYIAQAHHKFWFTKTGKRAYNKAKQGRYF